MKEIRILAFCFIFTFIVSSCQASMSEPTLLPALTATINPTKIIAPTETLISTETPTPTKTLEPTSTFIPPTPTIIPPEILSELMTNVQMLSIDSFESLDNWMKWNDGTGYLSNGTFVLTGQSGWMSGLELKDSLGTGDGLVLSFKVEKRKDFDSEFVFATGQWKTDSFRQFGVYNGLRPKADLYQGTNGLGFKVLNGNLNIIAGTWYRLVMAIGRDGEFLAIVYDPEDSTKKASYHEIIGKKWANLVYKFQAKANKGETLYLDDFALFSFDEIKK